MAPCIFKFSPMCYNDVLEIQFFGVYIVFGVYIDRM